MILRIIRELWRLRNADFIPKLPRGYAEHFERLNEDERRVLARLGGRSPMSAYNAMKKAGYTSLNGFVGALKHHRAIAPVRRRWLLMWARTLRAEINPPHRAEIVKATRRVSAGQAALKQRIKYVSEVMKRPPPVRDG